jgi:hypothetical protein
MNTTAVYEKKLTTQLTRFNLSHKVKDTNKKFYEKVVIIYLPFLCYLKVFIGSEKVKMSSKMYFGFTSSLEWNFLFYSLTLMFLTAIKWGRIDHFVFVFLYILLVYVAVCFVKLEALKVIVTRWLDKEN